MGFVYCGIVHFYPRSPCGERLQLVRYLVKPFCISIHALLAESDREPTAFRTPHQRFLSTLSLRRATMQTQKNTSFHKLFLSTLSLRRATMDTLILTNAVLFLSTLSLRRATLLPTWDLYQMLRISIHALLAESDIRTYQRYFAADISIHALLAESDPTICNGILPTR